MFRGVSWLDNCGILVIAAEKCRLRRTERNMLLMAGAAFVVGVVVGLSVTRRLLTRAERRIAVVGRLARLCRTDAEPPTMALSRAA